MLAVGLLMTECEAPSQGERDAVHKADTTVMALTDQIHEVVEHH
jgi:hypothetical protein